MSFLGSPLKLAVFPELATGKARKIVFLEFKAAAYGQSTVQRWLEKRLARGGRTLEIATCHLPYTKSLNLRGGWYLAAAN